MDTARNANETAKDKNDNLGKKPVAGEDGDTSDDPNCRSAVEHQADVLSELAEADTNDYEPE